MDHQVLDAVVRLGWLTLALVCIIIIVVFWPEGPYEKDDEE